MADELALPVKKTSRKASEAAAAKTDPETEGQYGRAEVFIRQFYRQHPPEENQQGFEGFKSWSDGDWDAKIERIIGKGCYFLVFVQLFEKYGTLIEGNTAL
eukprot:SAG31_NODE_104_length_25069_cov_12.917144_22_plen_101_part_00